MKFNLLLLLGLFLGTSAIAKDGAVDSGGTQLPIAEWSRINKTLVLHSPVAEGLYLSLDAQEKPDATYESDPFSLKNHERHIKVNKFAKCRALKEKVVIGGDAVKKVIKSVECHVKAPEGTVL